MPKNSPLHLCITSITWTIWRFFWTCEPVFMVLLGDFKTKFLFTCSVCLLTRRRSNRWVMRYNVTSTTQSFVFSILKWVWIFFAILCVLIDQLMFFLCVALRWCINIYFAQRYIFECYDSCVIFVIKIQMQFWNNKFFNFCV